MITPLQAVRGMNDFLPEQTPYWQAVEAICRDLCARYGYREIRFPIVEQSTLFTRSIGDATDIVEKEMYSFTDRNGDSLSLRPEGTAGCARAGIQHGLFYNQPQRLWYLGPMFRHERPQKGRYRQFHHFGIEAYGMEGYDIDAEVIFLGHRLLTELGLGDQIELQINCLGSNESRTLYKERLVSFYQQHYNLLDEDSQRRLISNPLRILDSKNPVIIELNQTAPNLLEHLDPPSRNHLEGLERLLSAAGIPYVLNPRLVRGLDYYELTVFEWVTQELGSQGTVCAGGRYNRLVEELGGKRTPAVGLACGLERLVLLLAAHRTYSFQPDIYLILMGQAATERGILLAEEIRKALPSRHVVTHLTGGGLKSQLKWADKSNARWAIILGEAEWANQEVIIKDLRNDQPQQKIALASVINFFEG